MEKRALLKAFLLVGATSCYAQAAEPLNSRILGSWRLVSVYDQFTDGTRRDTWGADPQGLIVFTPEGLFSAIIVAGQRAARAGAVPSEPVGPAVAYYGAYRIDEATSTFSTQVQQSTFPPWIGRTLDRTVVELTARSLKVVAAPIRDPSGREFVPHLEFIRVE